RVVWLVWVERIGFERFRRVKRRSADARRAPLRRRRLDTRADLRTVRLGKVHAAHRHADGARAVSQLARQRLATCEHECRTADALPARAGAQRQAGVGAAQTGKLAARLGLATVERRAGIATEAGPATDRRGAGRVGGCRAER